MRRAPQRASVTDVEKTPTTTETVLTPPSDRRWWNGRRARRPVPERRRYDRSIIEGPLREAVWKIAWPTMLTNIIGGLQGIVDHALVGNLVGYRANAAIGV